MTHVRAHAYHPGIFMVQLTRGASLTEMCDKLKISALELNDSEKYLDFDRAYKSWEVAMKATNDKSLGLHLGETTNPSILGLIGHLMQSSPTLISAFQSVCQYSKVATDMFFYGWEERDKEFVLTFQPTEAWIKVSEKSARQAVDQAMAGTLNVFKLLVGKNVFPVKACFRFSRPKQTRDYERIFQSALQFSSFRNELVFRLADSNISVTSYDKSLQALFRSAINKRSESFLNTNKFSDHVCNCLLEEFKTQIPPIEVVAARMNMTVRTFQRKLTAEGGTYRKLSGRLRKDLALKLMHNSNHKMDTIADMLGYSEASAFRRAFKSWN
ncbi:MAG: AraC family transcriptional regulator ligand-binding domain-containing protein [Cytophagales bacterium]|nr:AraC family transcriptional regulator ligand-binding domain-containing protein [Cytophagales bacterium]